MSENETAKIRVAMVDDHEMFRAGVIATLRDSFDIVGQAADVPGSVAMIAQTKPQVVLLDVHVSPVGTYKTLVDWYKKGDLDFSEVTTVNLDEYRGLTHDNDQSYYYFMNDNLFSHVNIDPAPPSAMS